jgi:P4 family phage/plasmid primase-like protien
LAAAPPPTEWLRFVAEVFPDPAAAELLQDWFDYLLLPDTSQQKIMLLVGPTRSDKGVIQHVITALVGAGNVCAPSPNSLGSSNVGALQPLIGTTVAFLSDARFGGRSDKVAITANLLAISAGDPMTIDRKHKAAWTGRLATRLVIMSNELPSLHDNSPALANRFTPLILEKSFLGREDVGLATRIIANELPGVLLWALEGWRRMRERGHFALPAASEEAIAEILDLGSPVAAFVNARCELGDGKTVEKEQLYRAYRAWCDATEQHAVAANMFSRDLGTATGGKVRPGKTRVGALPGQKLPVFVSIELRGELGSNGWHPGPEPGPAGLPFGGDARWGASRTDAGRVRAGFGPGSAQHESRGNPQPGRPGAVPWASAHQPNRLLRPALARAGANQPHSRPSSKLSSRRPTVRVSWASAPARHARVIRRVIYSPAPPGSPSRCHASSYSDCA